MKRLFIFLLLAVLCQLSSFAGTRTWTGASGGNWSVAANWSGGATPSSTDTVVVNTSVTIVVDINPAIAGLQILNNATVIFSAAANRTINIGGSGTGAMVFLVDLGCTLTLGSGSGVSITTYGSSSTNTAFVKGTLIMGQGSTSWTINSLPLSKTNVSISGTVRFASNNTGSLLVSGTTATLVFLNGSTLDWQRNGGAGPNADFQNGSTIQVTGVTSSMITLNNSAVYNGLLIWNSASQTISGGAANLLPSTSYTMDSIRIVNTGTGTVRLATNPNGYTLGHLEVQGGTLEMGANGSANGGGTISTDLKISGGTLIGNATYAGDVLSAYAGNVTVNGNFTMTGGTFELTNRPTALLPGGAFIITIKGDASQTAGTIQCTSAFGSQNEIVMQGAVMQNLLITNMTGFESLYIWNNNGVNLQGNLTIPYFLVLQQGYLQINNYTVTLTYPGLIQAVATPTPRIVTNGSGELNIKTIANTNSITFPVAGSSSTYNPVLIKNTSGSTFDFRMRVENAINPPIGYPLIGLNRTWTFTPSTTPASVDATFYYFNGDGNAGFVNTNTLELGQNISSVWNVVKTGIIPSGSYQAAVTSITTLGAGISSPMVLGNLHAILATGDALGVDAFTGTVQANQHWLQWQLQCAGNAAVTMELQRSNDAGGFNTIYAVNTLGTQCGTGFQYTDLQPLKGNNYYRVKLTDASGKIAYSKTLLLIHASGGWQLTGYSNPVKDKALLQFSASGDITARLRVTDISGKSLQQQVLHLPAGTSVQTVDLGSYATGIYFVRLEADNEKPVLVKLIKE